VVLVLSLGLAAFVLPTRAGSVSVIVSATGASADAARVVAALGGTVTADLPLIEGFAATVERRQLEPLRSAPAVRAVWENAPVAVADADDEPPADDDGGDGSDEAADIEDYDTQPPNGVWRAAIGLDDLPPHVVGEDVTVAVIDTGLVRHPDLGHRVTARVDVTPDADGYDGYGHGTHMTGIVAGDGSESEGRWRGVASGADILSVKVADSTGATDVTAVLAALQWVVSHREAHDIRVLNLSFGTDSTQSAAQDPLNFAVARAWEAGIVVVTAAGNGGPSTGTLDKPADDPRAITVGAADLRGTAATHDDVVADFSARGHTADGLEKPDLVAPGISIASLRAADSTVDVSRPAARVDDEYFKGTGTSQATAIVSGVAALVLQANPGLTPDAVKSLLVTTADQHLAMASGGGAGLVDAHAAVAAAHLAMPSVRHAPPAVGDGPLNDSRGSGRVLADLDRDGSLDLVDGQVEAVGAAWDAERWTAQPWTTESWKGSPWAPVTAVASGWRQAQAPQRVWSGMTWPGQSWSGQDWSGQDWSGQDWSGQDWSSSAWN